MTLSEFYTCLLIPIICLVISFWRLWRPLFLLIENFMRQRLCVCYSNMLHDPKGLHWENNYIKVKWNEGGWNTILLHILGHCNMFVSRTGWSMTLKCFSRGIKCAWLKMWLNESRAYLTYCGLNMSHDSLASIVLPIMDESDMMKFIKCPKLADSHDIDVFLFF